MTPRRTLLYLLLIPLVFARPTATQAADAARPNIVFILADDMGYGDVQVLNPASKIPTPNLNRLAAEGMTFTDAHTGSAVCTPTRYGVLTGRYCWRTRLKSGVLNGYSPHLIDPERLTVARLLRNAGYQTGVVGKWHLGLDFARQADGKTYDYSRPIGNGPNDLGFDFSHVIPASLDFPPYVFIRNQQVLHLPVGPQEKSPFPAFLRAGERSPDFEPVRVLDDLADQAVGFIRRGAKADRPFFLYFPLTAPHKPVLPHPRFRGKTQLGPYGDFVVQTDATVGRILDTLEETGVAGRTLVFFTSDNGSYMYREPDTAKPDHVADEGIQAFHPEHHTANFQWRGTKADIWEAGHRVPFFVRWPGRIPAGSREDATICLTDFMATCAEITRASLPDNAAEDSFSLLPALHGQAWTRPTPVIHHSAGGMFSIREGAWKLVLGNGSGGREKPRGKPFDRPYFLSNLKSDPGENRNQAESQPDIAERLEKTALRIRDSGSSR